MHPKIDIFAHILPPKYRDAIFKQAPSGFPLRGVIEAIPTLSDLDHRFRIMDKYEGLVQVLTTTVPPVESIAEPKVANELARMANDEVAELVAKYPDRFVAGVANLPMNDIDSALKEMERAINVLKFRGVQIYTNVNGEPLDLPKFMPLYEKMAGYNLPIWLHPRREHTIPDYRSENKSRYSLYSTFGWPYETALAMGRLVFGRVLEKYPDIKFITHHCGGLVPYFEQRIVGIYDVDQMRSPAKYTLALRKHPIEYFRMFYNDTAVYGSLPALMCGYAFFGAEHILFGTDMPYDSQLGDRNTRETVRAISEMNISDVEKNRIFADNAKWLLRLAI